MASPFQQYQGGIAPIAGIAEAGANIGRMSQQGLASFGQSLAEGIQKYQENSAENQMIDQEAQGLGQQLKQYHDMFANNPEYADFSKQLSPFVDKLSKIPEMSLAQKRGALNGAKVAFSQIGTNLQMYDKFLQMEKLSAMQKTLDTPIETNLKGESLKYSAPLYVKEALRLFDYKKDYASQEQEFIAKIYQQNNNNPKNTIDVTQALASYRQAVKDASTELAKANPIGNVISEQVDAQIARRSKESLSPAEQMAYAKTVNVSAEELAKARGLSKNTIVSKDGKGQTTKTSAIPVKSIDMESDSLNKYLVKDKNGKLTTNKNYADLPVSNLNRNTQFTYIDAKNAGVWDEEAYQKAIKADAELEANVNPYQRKEPNENAFYKATVEKMQMQKFNAAVKNPNIAEYAKGNFGEIGIPDDALKLAKDLRFNRSDYGIPPAGFGEMLPFGTGAVLAPIGYGEALDKLPPALKDFYTRIENKDFNPETGQINRPEGVKPSVGKNSWDKIEAMKPTWEQTAKTGAVPSVAGSATTTPAKGADKSTQLKLNDINIGSQEQMKALPQAERTQILKQTFAKILGKKDANGNFVVPYDFDQTMKFFAPSEPVIKNIAGVGMMLQQPDGKWERIQGQGLQDMRKEGIGIYGSVDPETGEMREVEVGIEGSGIMVSGMFKGSDAANDKFQEEITAFSDARRGLRRMIEVNNMTGEVMSPTLAGEMRTEVAMVIAAIRRDVVGGGQVSDYENKLLQRIVDDPTKLFQLESTARASLQSLLERTERKILAYGNGKGLSVRLANTGLTPTQSARNKIKGL